VCGGGRVPEKIPVSSSKHEKNADNGDLFSMGDRTQNIQEDEQGSSKGKVIDLVIPILCLVVCCVIGMIYTGGFFKGKDQSVFQSGK